MAFFEPGLAGGVGAVLAEGAALGAAALGALDGACDGAALGAALAEGAGEAAGGVSAPPQATSAAGKGRRTAPARPSTSEKLFFMGVPW